MARPLGGEQPGSPTTSRQSTVLMKAPAASDDEPRCDGRPDQRRSRRWWQTCLRRRQYDSERGANHALHVDDTWLWGERIIGVCLGSESVSRPLAASRAAVAASRPAGVSAPWYCSMSSVCHECSVKIPGMQHLFRDVFIRTVTTGSSHKLPVGRYGPHVTPCVRSACVLSHLSVYMLSTVRGVEQHTLCTVVHN